MACGNGKLCALLFDIAGLRATSTLVMPGLAAFAKKLRRPDTQSPAKPRRRRDPGIHQSSQKAFRRRWITGSSSAKTRFALLPGDDDLKKPLRCLTFASSCHHPRMRVIQYSRDISD